jgi:hypothetical protein
MKATSNLMKATLNLVAMRYRWNLVKMKTAATWNLTAMKTLVMNPINHVQMEE